MLGSSVSPVFDELQFSSAELRRVTGITDKNLSRWEHFGHIVPGRAVNGGRAYSLEAVVRTTFLMQLTGNVGMPVADAALASDIAINYLRDLLPTNQAGEKVLVLDAARSTICLCLAKQDGKWCSGLVDPDRPGYVNGDYVYAHIILPFQEIANFALFEVISPLEVAA